MLSRLELPPVATGWRDYVAIARPDHWFKNVFMVPGIVFALVLQPQLDLGLLVAIVVGVVSTCLIASANYTINEWLDAACDRHHPTKYLRPSAAGRIAAPLVYLQWAVLATTGLTLAATLNQYFLTFSVLLLVMGLVYNVPPVRTKDRPYLDVLSESVNNPLRFLLGWSIVISTVMPPSSILLAYWMAGAYLMAVKRYAEYRFIGDPDIAGRYRESFKWYSEERLLASSFFYALSASFFLGVFLIKYRIEFILCLPFLALLFTWYLVIGMRAQSAAQTPELLYRERSFMAYVGAVAGVVGLLFLVDLPWLHVLAESRVTIPPAG